jgi:hypothetical protein
MNEPSFNLSELRHIMALLNGSHGCEICASARVKCEQMIAEYPKTTTEQIGEHTVTRERGINHV